MNFFITSRPAQLNSRLRKTYSLDIYHATYNVTVIGHSTITLSFHCKKNVSLHQAGWQLTAQLLSILLLTSYFLQCTHSPPTETMPFKEKENNCNKKTT